MALEAGGIKKTPRILFFSELQEQSAQAGQGSPRTELLFQIFGKTGMEIRNWPLLPSHWAVLSSLSETLGSV